MVLAPGKSGSIRTQMSGTAQSMYQLQVGLETLASILDRFGAGSIDKSTFSKVTDLMGTALQSADCSNAVRAGDAGAAFAACFGPKELADLFGWEGVLMAPVAAFGGLVNFFHTEANAIGDQLNGRDEYRLTISRSADFSRFVGKWYINEPLYLQGFTVNSDGVAVLKVDQGGDPSTPECQVVTMHLVTYNEKPAVKVGSSNYSAMRVGHYLYLGGPDSAHQIWFQVPGEGDTGPLLEAMPKVASYPSVC